MPGQAPYTAVVSCFIKETLPGEIQKEAPTPSHKLENCVISHTQLNSRWWKMEELKQAQIRKIRGTTTKLTLKETEVS